MSKTQTVLRAYKESIPAEKWPAKLGRIVIGLCFIAAGWALTVKLGVHWAAAAIGTGIGMHIWAGEVVNKTLMTLPKLVAAGISDVLGAIMKGRSGTPPEPPASG